MSSQPVSQELTEVENALLDALESAHDTDSAELVSLVRDAIRATEAAQQLAEELGL